MKLKMKIIEKIALALFSNIILIIAILLCLIIFGWLDFDVIHEMLRYGFNDTTISSIILGTCVVLILLAIKCIFFESISIENEVSKEGIMLENESGRLMVTKETLENLTNSVVNGFENTESITSKVILDKENNVRVIVNLTVKPDTVIKDLSNNLQERIKETIKKSLDLDVKEVNIKVKNIAPKADAIKKEN